MFLCVIYFQTAADASPVLCNVLSGTPDKTGSNTPGHYCLCTASGKMSHAVTVRNMM